MNFVFSCSLFVQFYFGNSLSLFFSFTIFFSYKQIQIIWLILHFSWNYLPPQKKKLSLYVYMYMYIIFLSHSFTWYSSLCKSFTLHVQFTIIIIFSSLLSSFLSFNYSTVTFLPYVVVVWIFGFKQKHWIFITHQKRLNANICLSFYQTLAKWNVLYFYYLVISRFVDFSLRSVILTENLIKIVDEKN